MSTRPLSNIVCVITGASRGIGRQLAAHLAMNGASLALCARDGETIGTTGKELESAYGAPIVTSACDVTRDEDMSTFASKVHHELGPASVLVNNAAIFGPVGLLGGIDLSAWRRAIEVNLCGPATTTRAFWEQLAMSNRGRVVNLSGGGVGGPTPLQNASAYVASKAALVVLTESLAGELQPLGVTVNAVAPGAVATGFMDEVHRAGPERAGPALTANANTPTDDRVPDGFLSLIDFLISPESDWLTGRFLSARWDTPTALVRDRSSIEGTNRYQLRRIDEDLYCEGHP